MCHILCCPHVDCQKAWDEKVAGFCEWMISSNMDPDIHACTQAALKARDPNTVFHAYFLPQALCRLCLDKMKMAGLTLSKATCLVSGD
jgi:hypothetical protein